MSIRRKPVEVIALDNPPVNSLGHALRRRLMERLDSALADADVQAVVLIGVDRAFSAGADITEFATARQLEQPTLSQLVARIESSTKPVVAAISGVALGGGLELALACHARLADTRASIGMPEILLGLIPGAGGTQRLPRLIGLDAAYALMHVGQPRNVADFELATLFVEIVDDDLLSKACAYAAVLATGSMPHRSNQGSGVREDSVRDVLASKRAALTARQRAQPAYLALIEALEATPLTLEAGLRKERELFLELMETSESCALRHQLQAERHARVLPAGLQVPAREHAAVAVIGAGTMGTGIAIALLDAGLHVTLLEQDEQALARGRQIMVSHYSARVAARKLSDQQARERMLRLVSALSWDRLANADVVIEAVYEDLAVKQSVFRQIDIHARAGAVLATNTSYLDVDAIAGVTSRPEDVLGLHFFSPANVMKLLEVVRGAHSSPETLSTGMALGSKLGKTCVLTGNAFGFIGNRIYNAYRRQCEFMLEDGAWPEEVDAALLAFGFAMGPFAVADLSGLDIAWRMRQAHAPTRDSRERYVWILDRLCEAGRLGRKSGSGYYRHVQGHMETSSDGFVRGVITEASAARGIVRRSLTSSEIQRRALLAMANEAALLIEEGVAQRASDIDVVMVNGYGFPRWQGGPVFWGARQARDSIERDLSALVKAGGHGMRRGSVGALLGAA